MLAPEPAESASLAGLRYVVEEGPCIRRRRSGSGFAYLGPDGRPIRDAEALRRIKALAVPPAWRDVWICPDPHGHLQATGRDAKGRKQYRYHPRWRGVRDAAKYERMVAFGEALAGIRERVERDLALPGLARDKVLAAVVRLLDETSVRVGNEEYRRENRSFGLTTLRNRHVSLEGSRVRFDFRGKGGKRRNVELADARLARIIKRCQEIPGQELFQYIDESGERHSVESADVNAYLRQAGGGDFTAKDFRTWNGTVLAACRLRACEPCRSASAGRRQVAQAIAGVAEHLGNTPAICRKAYVHPAVIDAYLAGSLAPNAGPPPGGSPADPPRALSVDERWVLGLLRSATAGAGLPSAPRRGEPRRARRAKSQAA